MRNLDDMNDLYNAQDVILLCEIIENQFQMHDSLLKIDASLIWFQSKKM